MVVYTSDGEFREVAERIAEDRGASVVTDLETVVSDDETIVWVDDPGNLDEHELVSLQQRLVERGPDRGGFSIVTGYTPELAEQLYFERVDANGEDALLYNRHWPDEIPESPETNYLLGHDVDSAALDEITSEPVRSFSVEGPGRGIHVSISDGYICGIPDSQDIEDYPEPQPFCVEDGERNCPLSDTLISAESIDAAHVFNMTCSSGIDNGTSRLPANVGLGLLNGAESLVGPYRIAPGMPHEMLLHRSLLAGGYDVTERCYLLCKNSHVNDIMSLPYVPFGRPSARATDVREPNFEVELEADDELRARVTDVDAHVVDFRIPAERVPEYDDRLFVRNETDTDVPVYYTAFEEGDGARVVVYTGRRMFYDRLELTVSGHRARHVEREVALDSARNVSETAELGFLTDDAAEQVTHLEERLRKFPNNTADERYDAGAHEDVEQRLSSMFGHLDAIRDDILSSLRSEAEFPVYAYAANAIDDDAYPSERDCTICGDRPVFLKQISGWSGDAKRVYGSCPRCGHVFDVPVDGKDTDPNYPVVRAQLDADGPREQPMEIAFENDTDEPVQATFQPILTHMDHSEFSFFDPQRREAIVLPGESHTAEFTVDTSLIPDNTYYVMGLVVANLDVYVGFDTTVKGAKAAYYPRHLREGSGISL